MRKSFKIQAGLSLGIGVFALLTSALTLLPGEPLFSSGLVLAVQFLPLFPFLLVTTVRGWGLSATGVRGDGGLKRQAFHCLPGVVRYGLIGCFLTGIALVASSMLSGTALQAGDSEGGQYYAIQFDGPGRERVVISEQEYNELLKKDRRVMHAIVGTLATGAGAMTLIIGQLHPSAGRQLPPPGSDGVFR